MGKSIRSNAKKAFRSQRRATIEQEPVYKDSETKRQAAIAKCIEAPKLSSAQKPANAFAAAGAMDVDAKQDADAGAAMDVDMDSKPARKGPNQYKKMGLLRGAKARAGANKKDSRSGSKAVKLKVRQHGVSIKGKRKPRFSKSSGSGGTR